MCQSAPKSLIKAFPKKKLYAFCKKNSQTCYLSGKLTFKIKEKAKNANCIFKNGNGKHSTGCANKKQSIEKIHYLSYCNSFFFTRFTAFSKEDSRHTCSKFRHNICYGLKLTTI